MHSKDIIKSKLRRMDASGNQVTMAAVLRNKFPSVGRSILRRMITEILIHKLRQSGRMAHVEEECQILESREWVARPFDPDGYLKIKGSSALSDSSKRVLCRLYLYRDGQARQLDRPSFKVIPDSVLLALAKKQPTTPDSLNKLFAGKAPMKRRHGDSMLEAVRAGLEDDFAIPTKRKERPKGPKPKVTGRAAERGFQALKRWRYDLCANNDRLSPVTVVSNSTLKSIVQHYPTTIEQLTAIKEVRNWQVQEYGEQILEIIREVLPLPIPAENASHTAPSPKRKRKRRNSKQNKAEESSPESSVDS